MSSTTYDDILYAVDAGVATITINRPDRLNAFTQQTLREMISAVGAAADDREVGVIVITGAGDRAFCAGGDVNVEDEEAFSADSGDALDALVKVLYEQFRSSLKPIIARVNGYAIGGGHHMAYMCDFTIASDDAVFGQNGPRVASPAEGWLVSYLWTVVGMKRAKEIWMLCRKYPASQAVEWGLANTAVPASELDAEVRRWCDELLALSPTVLKLVKHSFDISLASMREQQDRHKVLPIINAAFFESGEQEEGANAFLEKRTADFSSYR